MILNLRNGKPTPSMGVSSGVELKLKHVNPVHIASRIQQIYGTAKAEAEKPISQWQSMHTDKAYSHSLATKPIRHVTS
jgi:hypothetical protein